MRTSVLKNQREDITRHCIPDYSVSLFHQMLQAGFESIQVGCMLSALSRKFSHLCLQTLSLLLYRGKTRLPLLVLIAASVTAVTTLHNHDYNVSLTKNLVVICKIRKLA